MIVKCVAVIIVTSALIWAVVGLAASLNVSGAAGLGSGSASVVAPTSGTGQEVKVTDVEWFLDTADSSQVFSLRVTFAPIATTNFDAVYLVLKGTSGVLQQKTLLAQDIDNTPLNAHQITWPLSPLVPAADITQFAITIVDSVP